MREYICAYQWELGDDTVLFRIRTDSESPEDVALELINRQHAGDWEGPKDASELGCLTVELAEFVHLWV